MITTTLQSSGAGVSFSHDTSLPAGVGTSPVVLAPPPCRLQGIRLRATDEFGALRVVTPVHVTQQTSPSSMTYPRTAAVFGGSGLRAWSPPV